MAFVKQVSPSKQKKLGDNWEKAISEIDSTIGIKGYNEIVRTILKDIVKGVYLETDLKDLITRQAQDKLQYLDAYKKKLDRAKKPKSNSKSPLKSSLQSSAGGACSSEIEQKEQKEQQTAATSNILSAIADLASTNSNLSSAVLAQTQTPPQQTQQTQPTQQQQERARTPPQNPQQPQQGEDSRMAKSKIVLSILLCALVVLLLILWLFGESFSLMQTVTKTDAQGVKTEKREFHVVKLILMIVGAIVGGCIGYLIAKPHDLKGDDDDEL